MSAMIQLNLVQGSEAWADNRLRAFNASEAPVIMGCHPNMRRDELLEAKATCNPKQFSEYTQTRVFAKGHATEASARPILEAKLGEELYPICGRHEKLQASFDGLTILEEVGFEHKQWNAELALLVGKGAVPAYIFWQLEHQLAVCPTLEKIILVVSDGTENNWAQFEYAAVPGRREQLLAAWDQFEQDLADFKPTEKKVEAAGVRPDSLPALFVEIAGTLSTSSNLEAFRAGAHKLIGSIKTDLQTDQDFADADAAIKWLAEAEGKIDTAIESAMARTGPLEELVRILKDVQHNLMRKTRLDLNKKVEAQKVNRRNQIVEGAQKLFDKFLSEINSEFSGASIDSVKPDFYLCIKNKRSFDAMVSACNDLVAKSKIEVNEIAGKVRKNLGLLGQHEEHKFLFSNRQQLAFMDYEHLALTVKSKIDDYKAEQERTETARKQEHLNAIAGIEAAGEFGDDVPLTALLSTRDRIGKQDITGLQEFAIKGDQVKVAILAKLDTRIAALREVAEAAKPAPAVVPTPVVAPAIEKPRQAAYVGRATSTAPQTAPAAKSDPRPTDREMAEAIAERWSVPSLQALEWLQAANWQRVSDAIFNRTAA